MLPSFFLGFCFFKYCICGALRPCRKSLLYFTWSSLDSPQSGITNLGIQNQNRIFYVYF